MNKYVPSAGVLIALVTVYIFFFEPLAAENFLSEVFEVVFRPINTFISSIF
jgi:hypothetical protein